MPAELHCGVRGPDVKWRPVPRQTTDVSAVRGVHYCAARVHMVCVVVFPYGVVVTFRGSIVDTAIFFCAVTVVRFVAMSLCSDYSARRLSAKFSPALSAGDSGRRSVWQRFYVTSMFLRPFQGVM